uniref:Uncharacterized protein n=1 Tax=Anguilla anguilla TaxID=7936 RepID=A0A0E9UMW0_ANGAN
MKRLLRTQKFKSYLEPQTLKYFFSILSPHTSKDTVDLIHETCTITIDH